MISFGPECVHLITEGDQPKPITLLLRRQRQHQRCLNEALALRLRLKAIRRIKVLQRPCTAPRHIQHHIGLPQAADAYRARVRSTSRAQ